MSEKKQSIGALWRQKSKAGKEYMSGTINGVKVVVFANEYKKEDKHPDYRIFDQDERKEQQAPPPPPSDDDLPF